jgi:peroxiredoxin
MSGITVGEAALRTGVSAKAVRYYESLGLLTPVRLSNGYRNYSDHDVPACRGDGAWAREEATIVTDLNQLPPDLPVPADDGAADHLPGRPVSHLALPATSGEAVVLDQLGPGRTVLYVYPLTGRPDADLPDGWDNIPGARGCTAEACGFRDHHDDLRAAGAARVFGLSSQDSDYQREVASRLRLPFAMLSDTALALAELLALPTFRADGMTLFKRLTLVISDGTIEHAFYPVFPANEHAQQVLAWLRSHPAR